MSEPMEEYEVRDASHRSEAPQLKLTSDTVGKEFEIQFKSTSANINFGSFDLGLTLCNEAIEPAFYAVVSIAIHDELEFISKQLKVIKKNGVYFYQHVHGNDKRIPVFDGINIDFMDSRVKITYPPKDKYRFSWEIRSPKMDVKIGEFALDVYEKEGKYYGVLS